MKILRFEIVPVENGYVVHILYTEKDVDYKKSYVANGEEKLLALIKSFNKEDKGK